MRKILFLFTLLAVTIFSANAVYAAGVKFDGTVAKNQSVGASLGEGNLVITLNSNEQKILADKITVTLNGAVWENYESKGSINSEVKYELTSSDTMKLSISTNEEMLKNNYSFNIPLNCKIIKARQSISATIDYGYADIQKNTVNFASCEISRAYLEGKIKDHSTGDRIYQKSSDLYYNKLKIRVTPDDAVVTRDKISITLDGMEWTDYKDTGVVTCDRGKGANYRKINDKTLEIYFNEFNSAMKYQGYTLTLPLTGTITGKGEIKAVVNFGTESIDDSTVVFARVPDGEISLKAENPDTPVDNCCRLGNIVINDSSTQGYKANTKIELELGQAFSFANTPILECSEKFDNKCKIEVNKDNPQKCTVTLTSTVDSGIDGTIKLINPVIKRSSNAKSSFENVTLHMTATGWEKYDCTANVAKYQQGVKYIPPLQIKAGNINIGANKYSKLSTVTLTDDAERSYNVGDEIELSFDNGYRWFTEEGLPKIKFNGKFEGKCQLVINGKNPEIATIRILSNISSGSGSIVINGIVIERNSDKAFKYVSMTANVKSEDNAGTGYVAKFSSLYNYTPVITTTTEATTETTTATVNENKTGRIVKLKIGDVNYTVDGENNTLLAPPYIKDGYTMLPMRALANISGITDENISYSNGSAVFKIAEGIELNVIAGKAEYSIAGQSIKCSAEAEIINGTMFLPMRDMANAIGVQNDKIAFDAATKTITIEF